MDTSNYSAGVPRDLQGPLAGCGVSPPFSLTPPPEAAQEKGDLNSYVYKFLRIMTPKLPIYAEQCMIGFAHVLKKYNILSRSKRLRFG
jgi:hypothetical protein